MKQIIMLFCLVAGSMQVHGQNLQRSQISQEISGARERFQGLRAFRVVLDRVLYRGGGPGGTIPLRDNHLQALCADGFSSAGYLYPTNFDGPKEINCGQNSIRNTLEGFREAGGRQTLQKIHEIIQSQSTSQPKGPMFLHCWNGWHASGEISAYALRQFCGMSGDEAAQYWAENIGDKGNLSKYRSIMNRIRNFQKISGLEITPEQKARICPR